MAAKYTTVLAALLAVLSSGTRRKPEYIRQQALVSQLYPYYEKEGVFAEQFVYEFYLQQIAVNVEVLEALAAEQSVYEFLVTQPIKELFIDESFLAASQSVYEFVVTTPVQTYTVTEDKLSALQSVYAFSVLPLGILVEILEDKLQANQSVYEFYVGEPV